MPPTPSRRRDLSLLQAAAWSHRWGTLAWAVGAGGFLTYFGTAYATTVKSFQGGAAAFATLAAPTAEAMRFFSGPAERLDTYGGYVSYHNATWLAGVLSIWALVQGARAIRGWEERGVLQLWLASGLSRSRVLVARWLGFLVALAVVAVAVGLGFGAGMAVAGEPNWPGSFAVAGEVALVAAAFFGLGLLVAQFTRTSRAGAGIAATVALAMYFLNNMYPRLGWLGGIRFATPFFYYHQSMALIPGHHVDATSTAVLAGAAAALVPLAAVLLARRDIGGTVWQRKAAEAREPRRPKALGIWTRDLWLLDLRGSWVALAGWALASGLLMAVLVGVAGQVTSIWESSDLIRRMFGATPGTTIVDRYLSYCSILAAVVPLAFAVTQAAGWAGDLHDRRAEMLVATWGSRSRLVLEWAAGLTLQLIVVDLAVVAGAVAGGVAFGVDLRPDGLVRLAAAATLLGLGIGGVALLAVVLFRSEFAVGSLAALLGASFVVSVFGPLFNWPEWVLRLSPFRAFGTPYLTVPEPWGLALLTGLALGGTAAAALLARRRSLV